MSTTIAAHPLDRLAGDLRAAAWLLPDDDALRPYLEMLASLPACEEAWAEVLAPWIDDLRRGMCPDVTPPRAAVAGAVGVAALRTAAELPAAPVSIALRSAARWCFWVVRPAVR